MENIKTYAQWQGNLYDYLNPGDIVDQELIDHVVNCLPPETFRSGCFQLGEPYTSDYEGHELYYTFTRYEGNTWEFKGFCRSGETVPVEKHY